MLKRTALAFLTFCSATVLSGCETKRVVQAIATPADKLVCEAAGARPVIPPEYVIDWAKVSTVAQAHAEHDKYVAMIRNREGIIAAYILNIEGKLFICGSNMQWRRDVEAAITR